MKVDRKLGLFYEESVDQKMIGESIKNYDIFDYSGLHCLDLGANIGGFTKIALMRGARKVEAVECDTRNHEILKLNTSSYDDTKCILYHGAVSGLTDKTVKIFKSSSGLNHASTSINKKTGMYKEYDEVTNYHIKDFLDREARLDVIKIDIEGAEYDILDDVLNYTSNKILFCEMHLNSKTEVKCQEFIQKMRDTFSTEVYVRPIIAFKKIFGYDCCFSRETILTND